MACPNPIYRECRVGIGSVGNHNKVAVFERNASETRVITIALKSKHSRPLYDAPAKLSVHKPLFRHITHAYHAEEIIGYKTNRIQHLKAPITPPSDRHSLVRAHALCPACQ